MDVFALDFDIQGAAVYASTLLQQVKLFVRTIDTIIEDCHLADRGITIIAHLIGACVVRLAMTWNLHIVQHQWTHSSPDPHTTPNRPPISPRLPSILSVKRVHAHSTRCMRPYP